MSYRFPLRAAQVAILLFLFPPILSAQPAADSIPPVKRVSTLSFDIAPVISWHEGMTLAIPGTGEVERIDRSGLGFAAGMSLVIWLGQSWGMLADVRYVRQYVSAEIDRTIPTQVETDPNDRSDPPVLSHPVRMESSLVIEILQATAVYLQEFARLGEMRLGLGVGPGFAYVLGSNQRETITLDPSVEGRFFNPSGLPLEADARTMIIFDHRPPGQTATRLSLLGVLQLELPISGSFSFLSSIEYDYAFAREFDGSTGPVVHSLLVNFGIGRTRFE